MLPYPAILDSVASGFPDARFTVVAVTPLKILEWHPGNGDPFTGLGHALDSMPVMDTLVAPLNNLSPAAMAFPGGWIGFIGYEAGRYVERLPQTVIADVGLPVARWAFYDSAAVYDAQSGEWTLVALDLSQARPDWPAVQSPARRLAIYDDLLAQSCGQFMESLPPPPPCQPIHNMTRSEYESKVARAIDYIAAGDIFQVNLARRETYPVQEPPVATYLRLRRTNPGAYAAYLKWPGHNTNASPGSSTHPQDMAILSSSPELFLRLSGREVLTRPIKGTRPRSTDRAKDRAYRQSLAVSPKDRAELAMIVDLERNDLGRVCEFGTIRVIADPSSPSSPYSLETHPTVHHLVGQVTGHLRRECNIVDLLRATFPGGSITGAPKVRAMEIIDELEPTERSVYTGAIGYISVNGSMMLNIAIRTLILANNRIHLYTGGGIVADSRPDDEYRETESKALGLRQALGISNEKE